MIKVQKIAFNFKEKEQTPIQSEKDNEFKKHEILKKYLIQY